MALADSRHDQITPPTITASAGPPFKVDLTFRRHRLQSAERQYQSSGQLREKGLVEMFWLGHRPFARKTEKLLQVPVSRRISPSFRRLWLLRTTRIQSKKRR
jgi:hypothetical protein